MGGGSPPGLDKDDDLDIPIVQLDGNMTLDSLSDIFEDEIYCKIPTKIGFRPPKVLLKRPLPTLITIRRDNRKIIALTLPKIVIYNMRSLWSKYESLAEDIHERESDLNFLTEIWEVKENKKHQFKLEALLEMRGIKYISTPRPGNRRGGGAAIATRQERFLLTKLNIAIPNSVEVVWGLLKPKNIIGKLTTIIVCCFYSPPRSRKNSELIDHITVTLQSLLNIHSNAGVIISGDKNDMKISEILSIDPSFHQIVSKPTRGNKILDVIVTNLRPFYDEPIIVPPVQPDKQGHGVPSDHDGVMVASKSNMSQSKKKVKVKKIIRPLPESLIPV